MSRSDTQADVSAASYRQGGPQDAAILEKMVRLLAADLGSPEKKISSASDFAAAFSASPPLLHAVIAETADNPVGLCLWFPFFSTWRGQCGVFVQDLYVAPQMRGSGLGPDLLRETLSAAGNFSPRFLRLSVNHTNGNARRFYARLGFSEINDESALDLSGKAFAALCRTDP